MELKTIIGKDVLLEQLRENKERYVETRKKLIHVYKLKSEQYKLAYVEYSRKVVESSLVEDEDRPFPPSIPEDRTETYDMYIEMIEKHVNDTLEIDSGNFNKLFMDKWDFIKQHIHAMSLWADTDTPLMAALTAYGG